jgi:hypothetical protein
MTNGNRATNNPTTKPSLIASVASFFRGNPATVGSFLYIYVTTIGIVYSYVLYQQFRVNIFDYATTSDFILAAFRNPLTFLVALGAISFVLLFVQVVTSLTSKLGERLNTERYPRLLLVVLTVGICAILLLSIAAACVLAWSRTGEIREASSPRESVLYRALSGSKEQTLASDLQLIGATHTFVLFYDPSNGQTLVIPQAQITSIIE